MKRNDPEVVIRRAHPDDAAGMVAILNPIIEARVYSALDTPVTVESQRAFIEDFPARGILHVAEERTGGRLVGMQDVVPFADYTRAFDHVGVIATFVALHGHRRGIGARLFAATFQTAKSAGFEKIQAWVRADNEAGLRAYRGAGFAPIGTAVRQARINGRYIDEIVLERFI
jgi:L-amino acid N-acyltransferase YncA